MQQYKNKILRKILRFFSSNLVTANGQTDGAVQRMHSAAKSLDTSTFTRLLQVLSIQSVVVHTFLQPPNSAHM